MNKKVLSAILFSALFAGTGTFTSCIDTDEPAGIEELRGAKAELIRAKVSVEQANAAYKLAEAEVQKAEAARLNALAEIEKARAEYQELLNERESITNASAQADLDAKIEAAKQTAAEAALRHQATILTLETQLAEAQRQYDITMKQIEIAKALMNEGQLQSIKALEEIVDEKQAAVNFAMAGVKKAEKDVYDAAMNLDATHAYVAAKLALDLKYAETDLADAEEALEDYKNYLENMENADWYAEIKDIETELDSLEKANDALVVAQAKERYSEAYMALVDSLQAAEKAFEELEAEAPVLAEELTYTYKYLNGNQDVEKTIVAETDLAAAAAEIAGDDFLEAEEYAGFIAELKNDVASYTTEYKYWLDSIAATDATRLAGLKADADSAVVYWERALKAYEDQDTTMATKFAAAQKAVDGKTFANPKSMKDAAKAMLDYLTVAKKNGAVLNNVLTLADSVKVPVNIVDGEVKYESKAAYSLQDPLTVLADTTKTYVAYVELSQDFLASTGGATSQTLLDAATGKDKKFDFFTNVIKTAAPTEAELHDDLVKKSDDAFGQAELYVNYDTEVVALQNDYLHKRPTDADVKYVGYVNAGAYGTYLASLDVDMQFVANNYEAIIEDYEAAIEYWTAAVDEIKETIAEYNAALDAAEDAVEAADKVLADANFAIDEKYSAAIEALAKKAFRLENIKDVLEDFVTLPDYESEGCDTLEEWLKAKIKDAEYAIIDAEADVLEIEQAIKRLEDGMCPSALMMEHAEQKLAAATENLEKAQAELTTAMANLKTALEIMAAE